MLLCLLQCQTCSDSPNGFEDVWIFEANDFVGDCAHVSVVIDLLSIEENPVRSPMTKPLRQVSHSHGHSHENQAGDALHF